MSYEGRTSYAPRTFFRVQGHATTLPTTNAQLNCRFVYTLNTQPQQVRNPFNFSMMKLMPVVSTSYADANAFSMHYEGIALGDSMHIGGWTMWKTNQVVSERYAPPLSVGFSSVRYCTQMNLPATNDVNVNSSRHAHMEF
jgi:hypothetical protein